MPIRPKGKIPVTPFKRPPMPGAPLGGINPMRSGGIMPGRRIARRFSPQRLIRRIFSFLVSLIILAVILFLAYRGGFFS